MTFSKISKAVAAASLAATMALTAGVSANPVKLQSWAEDAGEAVNDVMKYPNTRIIGSGNGRVTFRVTVNRDGDVISSDQIARNAGATLNVAAKKVVKTADFPALPASYDDDTLTFELRLAYGVTGMGGSEEDLLRQGRVTSRQIAKKHGPAMAALRIIPAAD